MGVSHECDLFDDSFEHEAWCDGSSTRIVRELCVCQRVRDSYEIEFVRHVRESVKCYAFDDTFEQEAWHDGSSTRIVRELCVCQRVRDSCVREFVTHMRESS